MQYAIETFVFSIPLNRMFSTIPDVKSFGEIRNRKGKVFSKRKCTTKK